MSDPFNVKRECPRGDKLCHMPTISFTDLAFHTDTHDQQMRLTFSDAM